MSKSRGRNDIVDVEQVKSLLSLKKSGDRGWYSGDCPFCGKEGHMGVQLDEKSKGFRCLKCGEKGTIRKLLSKVGRLDLMEAGKTVGRSISPELLRRDGICSDIADVPDAKLPRGYRPIGYHEYLSERGFTPEQYEVFGVGLSTLSRMRDYIVFIVREAGKVKGYLGRSTWSNDRIKKYNEQAMKEDKHRKYLNSVSDFGSLLFGIDEIKEGSNVIVVEGITDKASVDRGLSLYDSDDIKCVCSFGKKLSTTQACKLRSRGVKNVAIFYDPDALPEAIAVAGEYSPLFDSVLVAFHPLLTYRNYYKEYAEKDAGDMSPADVAESVCNAQSVSDARSALARINAIKLITNNVD